MMIDRCVLVAALLAALASSGLAEEVLGVPTDGLDLVLVDDGRVLRCKVGAETDGLVDLEFPSEIVRIPASRIVRTRLFRDFDPTPNGPDEEAQVAKGNVRWNGKWMDAKRAEALREKEEAPIRVRREADAAHEKWEDRWRRETRHFEFEANVDGRSLEFFTELMEDYYEHFTKRLKVKLTQRERKNKLPVYVLRGREEFMAFHEKDTGGESEHLLGYFVPVKGDERLVFFDRPGGRDETVPVLLHEATHFLLHLSEPQVVLPRWVHEGVAEYYGASVRQGKTFVVGGVQDGRLLHFLDMVKRNKVVPSRDMFIAGNRFLPSGTAGIEFDSPHYAQAWVTVHYLMHGNKGRLARGFVDYLSRWLTGKGTSYSAIEGSELRTLLPDDDEALLLRCLKIKSMDVLMKNVIAYAKTLELRSPVAYVERGSYLLWVEKDRAGAEEAFTKARELGGSDPRVLYAMAREFSSVPGREGDALALVEQALALDPLDSQIRYRYARLVGERAAVRQLRICIEIDPTHAGALGTLAWRLYRDEMKDGYRAAGADLDIATEARGLAERAVALDPSADNLDTIAALDLVLGKFEEARDHAVRAVQLEPERTAYISRLIRAYAVCGDLSKYVKTLRRVELLLGRPQGGDGAVRSEADIRRELDDEVIRAIDLCDAWDKTKLALEVADGWYRRREPGTGDGWYAWADAVRKGEGPRRALEIATKGAEACPDSQLLKQLAADLAEEVK